MKKVRQRIKNKDQKLVTIGGGSGQFALLSGLRDLDDIKITAVVSMVDSGGSTGRLRDELGILPPGDVLKCILALSPHRDIARIIFLKHKKRDNVVKNTKTILRGWVIQYNEPRPLLLVGGIASSGAGHLSRVLPQARMGRSRCESDFC